MVLIELVRCPHLWVIPVDPVAEIAELQSSWASTKFPGCCTCTAIDVLELLENFHGKHQVALLKQNLNTWHVHAFKSHLDLLRRELLTSAKALRRLIWLICSGQHMSVQFTNSVNPHSWDRYINCRTATPKTVLPQATWKLMKLWTDASRAGNGPGSAQASTLVKGQLMEIVSNERAKC